MEEKSPDIPSALKQDALLSDAAIQACAGRCISVLKYISRERAPITPDAALKLVVRNILSSRKPLSFVDGFLHFLEISDHPEAKKTREAIEERRFKVPVLIGAVKKNMTEIQKQVTDSLLRETFAAHSSTSKRDSPHNRPKRLRRRA